MNQELRDKMYRIQGMLESMRFPIIEAPAAYYDLIDSIAEQYERVLKELNGMTAGMNAPKASCCSVHAGGYEECARPDDAHKKPEECRHEGMMLEYMDGSKVFRCKKCGEFYR